MPPIQAALFGQESDFLGPSRVRGAAQYLDCAGGGAEDIEDHAQDGGLAGPVGAEEADQLAFADGEAQTV